MKWLTSWVPKSWRRGLLRVTIVLAAVWALWAVHVIQQERLELHSRYIRIDEAWWNIHASVELWTVDSDGVTQQVRDRSLFGMATPVRIPFEIAACVGPYNSFLPLKEATFNVQSSSAGNEVGYGLPEFIPSLQSWGTNEAVARCADSAARKLVSEHLAIHRQALLDYFNKVERRSLIPLGLGLGFLVVATWITAGFVLPGRQDNTD